jgi:hypothetical protein
LGDYVYVADYYSLMILRFSPTGIEEIDNLPNDFSLSQNYPNPFNSSTVLRYTTPTQSPVTITIYDILGRKVQTLVDCTRPAGEHQVIWQANDIPSGVYFYRLTTGNQTQTKKMVMIR